MTETVSPYGKTVNHHKPELWWLLTDRWFRLLEFSLILGALYYFDHKTGNIILRIIYWISWFLFFSWFLEVGEYVIERFSFEKKLILRFLILIIVTLAIAVVFLLVTSSANILIEQQNREWGQASHSR